MAAREKINPGTIGSQKLSSRNSSVADSAIGTATPSKCSVITDAASNVPMPLGTKPRTKLEIMKLAKTRANGGVAPNDRIANHSVSASSSTIER